jgi:hypothetical protein
MIEKCEHRMPCNRCAKFNVKCDAPDIKCDHEWVLIDIYKNVEPYNPFTHQKNPDQGTCVCEKCDARMKILVNL